MLKIRRIVDGEFVVLAVSGRIDDEGQAQLESHVEAERQKVVLDLQEVNLVSREAVSFLVRFEERGGDLKNCPSYVREWMNGERGGSVKNGPAYVCESINGEANGSGSLLGKRPLRK